MAFFRCGGSGIPASLKSGMNSVLNKKFGTSTTYDPADWPADVNLLGPLPIKSASGAIASFADGADGVPVKSCVVSFVARGGGGTPSAPVAIQSVPGLSVTRTGKNFLDDTLLNLEQGGINGSTGANENANNRVRNANAITFPYDKIVSNYKWTIPNGYKVAIRPCDKDGNFVQLPSWALGFITQLPQDLVGKGITQMRFVFAKTDNSAITPSEIANIGFQIEVGSTATTYEAYTPSVVTQDTFGQTIMGGTRDLTTDKASVTWGYIASYNGETLTGRWVSSMDTYVAGTTPTIGAEVAYELATPTEITGLTPHSIDTLYGDNNIYSDTGTTEVEYRADIDLALNA